MNKIYLDTDNVKYVNLDISLIYPNVSNDVRNILIKKLVRILKRCKNGI